MKKYYLLFMVVLGLLTVSIPGYSEQKVRKAIIKTNPIKNRPLGVGLSCQPFVEVTYTSGVLAFELEKSQGTASLSVTNTETMEFQEWTVDTSAPVSVFIGEPNGDVEITLTTQQNTYTGTMYIY